MTQTLPLRRKQLGFSLIEVMVAVLILSIGLLGIVGLQARAIQHSVNAEDMSRAIRLADEATFLILNQGSVPLNPVTLLAWQQRVRDPQFGFGDGVGEISAPDANGVVRISILWSPPDLPEGAERRRYETAVAVTL